MNHDIRETIPPGAGFFNTVNQLFINKQKAALLYDDNGLTRGNGIIEAVYERDGRSYLRLDNGTEVRIDSIQAVNGLFASDYSEC